MELVEQIRVLEQKLEDANRLVDFYSNKATNIEKEYLNFQLAAQRENDRLRQQLESAQPEPKDSAVGGSAKK